ncbi:hypothetical protein [Clostridium cuniculi]|uniref:hypothetical protein n=1 Tax=Clostridium cuniculi TaxID=2548455 RepID=UPI0010554A94|nr:hypothetical protein [Clostridium cuniculi]
MEKILVTKGLNELKLLDSRINRKITEGEFVAAAKLSVPNVNSKISKEAYKANAKSDYQSIIDLIKRRNKIKSAIIRSNAMTIVDIAGKTMTVAEAIDKKSSIEYEISLLEKLTHQYKISLDEIIKENHKVDESIEQLLNTAYGKEGKEKITQASYEAIAEPYRKANEYGLVDSLDIEKLIKEMKDKIEGFLSEVDTALQISNSTTIIEID